MYPSILHKALHNISYEICMDPTTHWWKFYMYIYTFPSGMLKVAFSQTITDSMDKNKKIFRRQNLLWRIDVMILICFDNNSVFKGDIWKFNLCNPEHYIYHIFENSKLWVIFRWFLQWGGGLAGHVLFQVVFQKSFPCLTVLMLNNKTSK